uniref:Uncharacterized protein n=1 Tax=Schistocephalus solidus TaxID=70667 RepID=A0A0X3PJQ8_SCHSO
MTIVCENAVSKTKDPVMKCLPKPLVFNHKILQFREQERQKLTTEQNDQGANTGVGEKGALIKKKTPDYTDRVLSNVSPPVNCPTCPLIVGEVKGENVKPPLDFVRRKKRK